MVTQDRTTDFKSHFRRAKRIALALSLVAASNILFLVHEYDQDEYRHIAFWEVRWLASVIIFIVVFGVLWFGSRRSARTDRSEK